MSEGIRLLPNISHLFLAGNRLSEKGAKTVLSQLGKNTKTIDLADNQIGSIGCDHLYAILTSKEIKYII